MPTVVSIHIPSRSKVNSVFSDLENSQAMAALPLRASPPAAVAAASLISRPFHGAMNVRPLGRRGPSPAPVKLQARARDSFRSHCEKRADGLHEPDPEPENHDPDKVSPQTRAVQNRSICPSARPISFRLFALVPSGRDPAERPHGGGDVQLPTGTFCCYGRGKCFSQGLSTI